MQDRGVKAVFDSAAPTYDRARRQLVPCFEDFYATVLDCIPYDAEAAFRVLDLGAGTGLLSQCVAQRFPRAVITLLDISEEMLAQARHRFQDVPGRFAFVQGDYSEAIAGEFEVVASALSIHHLTDARKRALFEKVHGHLVSGGLFINADQVLGPTPELERVYAQVWLEQVHQRGVSESDLAAARERMTEDKTVPLDAQMRWLAAAGFTDVDCFYKNFRFAVFGGRKGGVATRAKSD